MNQTDAAGRDTPSDRTVRSEDPYRVLHLLPTAPHDLVVDIYWHLVGRRDDIAGPAELRRLNDAYAALLAPSDRPEGAAPAAGDDAGPPARPGARHDRALPLSEPAPASPWERLHIAPDAPPHVVDIAYEFWKVRLRGQSGESTETVDQLQDAYRAIRNGADGAQPSSPPTESPSQFEATPDAPPPQAPATTTSRDAGATAQAAARVISSGARLWAPRVWRLTCIIAALIGRWSAAAARMAWRALRKYVPPAWRTVRRLSVASIRWVLRRSVALGMRLLGEAEQAVLARDPEEPPELAPDAGVEERFAALAASRGPRGGAR